MRELVDCKSSVHEQGVSRHKTCLRAAKPKYSIGNFFRTAKPSSGNIPYKFAFNLRITAYQFFRHRSSYCTRAYGVYAYSF